MINLEKFDQLNTKLLNKLNEEYDLLTEDNDLFDTIQNPTEKLKQAELESSEAFHKVKDLKNANVDEKTVQAMEKKRVAALIDKKKADLNVTKSRQLKDIQNKNVLEELNVDDLTDLDMVSLAEEFEQDLLESSELNKLEQHLEDQKDDIKNDTKEKMLEIKNKKSDELNDIQKEAKITKSSVSENIDKNKDHTVEKAYTNINQLNDKANSKIQNIDRQLDKIQNLKEIEKTKKELASVNEGLIHNIKVSIANKKFDKLAKKRGDLVVKLNQFNAELKEAQEKNNLKKIEKIQLKINKIEEKLAQINEKYKKQNDKLVSLGEDAEFFNSLDLLCESIDNLLSDFDKDEKTNNYLEENALYQQNKKILQEKYDDPFVNKIVTLINEEFNKGDDYDESKVRVLLLKLNKIK